MEDVSKGIPSSTHWWDASSHLQLTDQTLTNNIPSRVHSQEEIGGLWSWKQKSISKISNHYAAMPSMHAGYSLWCSLSMFDYSPYKFFRILAVAYPFFTLYCIVVTANHFFLDAVFGAACYYLATRLTPYIPRIGRGSGSNLICGGPVPTGGPFLASSGK